MGNCCGTDVDVGTKAGNNDAPFSSLGEAEMAVAALTGAVGFSTWVHVFIRCQHLKDVDALTKSDPMVFFYAEKQPNNWSEVARTECVKNNLNPQFAKGLKTLYNFEMVQRFRVLVVDLDKGQQADTARLADCTPLGEGVFTLSELLTAKGRTLTRNLQHPKTKATLKGSFILSAEEMPNANSLIQMQVAGKGFANKDTFSKSDPFLQISRTLGDGSESFPVLRTETRNNNLNPVWDPIKVSATQLCNGDWYQKVMLEALDFDSNGKHALIGRATSSAQQLQQLASSGGSLVLMDGTKRTGELLIRSFTSSPQPSFLDYLAGGMEINFVVAVDFTASNGIPTNPSSLHHADLQTGYTPYEHAVFGVGNVIEFYDSDKLFPAFGFGAQIRGQPVTHCFPLNGDPQNPYSNGVAGVLHSYRQALQVYGLAGPTLFAPVIQAATALAAQPAAHLRYTCLLILTDGEIQDMDDTVDAIITASTQPMSILIVGVGNASFTSMVTLDADKKRLARNGRVAERDIVQFVEFNKFNNDGTALAAELLRELPGQVTKYMTSRNIPPPPRPAASPPPSAPPMPF